MSITYQITDDSGLLFLINPVQYKSFVDENLKLVEMINHFKKEIKKKNMIVWGTGAEGNHLVRICFGFSNIKGFREISRIIKVSSGVLCLLNYEAVSYAAMYSDVALPPDYMKEYLFSVPNGLYLVRIVQLDNPDDYFSDEYEEGLRFLIEFEKIEDDLDNPDDIPWFSENI